MGPEEPTVLDYVKSLLTFWKGKPLEIPPLTAPGTAPGLVTAEGEITPAVVEEQPPAQLTVEQPGIAPQPPAEAAQPFRLPWRFLVAVGLALIAQITLEPRPVRPWAIGLFLYIMAAGWLAWSIWSKEWSLASLPADAQAPDDFRVRARWLYACLPLVLLTFISLGGNRFTSLNVLLWLLAALTCVLALWEGPLPFRRWASWLGEHLRLPWRFSFSSWALLIVAVAGLVLFFRLYQLNQVPSEMVSDQAEKLLDIWDVLNGQPSIFFPRNTGREAFQMYLTAAVIKLFGTGYSFLSLKIGTVLCGLLTLPFIYGLGKEVSNRRAALIATILAGIGYWPNVVARAGLRYTLYPFFAAATLYYLVRGLRTRNRNDFIVCGLFLGAGLHGYSPFRIVPLIVVAAVLLYILHRQSKGARTQALTWLAVVILISAIVFLPLLRYMIENPSMVSYRALTRLSSLERPLPGPAFLIFLQNLWNALIMFAWDNGEVWVISIPGRPALDIISAALYHLGLVIVFVRYIRQRHWLDLFLLISIPLLLLSSILSLAFPSENPILNRTAAAYIPAFIIAGVALDGLLSGLEQHKGRLSRAVSGSVVAIALLFAMFQNYDLVFRQYKTLYTQSAWNTTEMGQVIQAFGQLTGTTDTAWLVGYPYWVDSRLVGINAGLPTRDTAIWPDALEATVTDSRAKLFLLNTADQPTVELLTRLYPAGSLTTYDSRVDKDFLMFTVPPTGGVIETTP